MLTSLWRLSRGKSGLGWRCSVPGRSASVVRNCSLQVRHLLWPKVPISTPWFDTWARWGLGQVNYVGLLDSAQA